MNYSIYPNKNEYTAYSNNNYMQVENVNNNKLYDTYTYEARRRESLRREIIKYGIGEGRNYYE